MRPNERITISEKNTGPSTGRTTKLMVVMVGIAIIVSVASLAVGIATLAKVYSGSDDSPTPLGSSTSASTSSGLSTSAPTTPSGSSTSVPTTSPAVPSMVTAIQIKETMDHLKELQRIADISNGNRAVSTSGFNRTLDYISSYLRNHTDYNLASSFFNIRQFELASNPILISSVNNVTKTYKYSGNLSDADFYFIQFSTAANFTNFQTITAIPNVGCTDADWIGVNPPPAGTVVLVKRGICPFEDKGALAAKYNATAILIYNDGTSPDRVAPIAIGLGQENQIPALFLSSVVGEELATAARNATSNAGVRMTIDPKPLPLSPVGNICADTLTGDRTQTIIIGSHSDSVPAGPGINDNGSGSAANLALAAALSRLFRTSAYPKYKYRIRFCWFGAEEIGLLGSKDHVKNAVNSTIVGERLQDYLINLNYDMLGSPNFIFGIYDGKTANNETPTQTLPGSKKVTAEFVEWFKSKQLPWTYTDFSGRSDYGPFLEKGIVAGGLFSGGDGTKTKEERDYYDQMLGTGMGGIAGITHDPCYHQACDSIQNINVFAVEKLIQAAAHMLEYLAQQVDLATWLYPNGRPPIPKSSIFKPKLDLKNERSGPPIF